MQTFTRGKRVQAVETGGLETLFIVECAAMIAKVINKRKLPDLTEHADLEYWLSTSPEERIATVEYLRRQYYGNSARLQRSARVIQRP